MYELCLQEMWFEFQEAGACRQPVGEYCESCGLTLETWPLQSKSELRDQYSRSKSFRSEFNLIRKGVDACKRREAWRKQEVKACKAAGMRIISKASFVTVDTFKAVEHVQPEDLKLPVLHLQKPDGGVVAGVMVLPNTTPAEVPHFDLEFYNDNWRAYDDWLLPHDQQHRAPQAKERFELALSALGQASMLEKVSKLEPYSRHKEAAQQHQRAAELALTGALQIDEVAPSQITVQSSSGLGSDGGLMLPPPEARQKKTKRAKDKGAGRNFRGGKGPGGRSRSVLVGGASRTPSLHSAASAASGRPSSCGGSQFGNDNGAIFAMDGESVANSSQAPSDIGTAQVEENAFWAEIQQVLLGQQLGRQFRRVPCLQQCSS